MKIVTLKVEIASFDRGYIPDEDILVSVLEEAVRNESGDNVTVRATLLGESDIDETSLKIKLPEKQAQKPSENKSSEKKQVEIKPIDEPKLDC